MSTTTSSWPRFPGRKSRAFRVGNSRGMSTSLDQIRAKVWPDFKQIILDLVISKSSGESLTGATIGGSSDFNYSQSKSPSASTVAAAGTGRPGSALSGSASPSSQFMSELDRRMSSDSQDFGRFDKGNSLDSKRFSFDGSNSDNMDRFVSVREKVSVKLKV